MSEKVSTKFPIFVPLRSRRRRKGAGGSAQSGSWLITFADMVTLLLTFLVLIISVTTMDPHTEFTQKEGVLVQDDRVILGNGKFLFSDRRILAPVVELVENLDKLPPDVLFDQKEMKDAIFQLDPSLSAEYRELWEAADRGVDISLDNRGLVVKWDRSLLFPEGNTVLLDENQLLLQKLAIFLKNISQPISVESHTNPFSALEGGNGPASYELSMRRSRVVMDYLVSLGLEEKRFRIGAHGGSRPLTSDPELAWENSRLEIVIYEPERSSPLGG